MIKILILLSTLLSAYTQILHLLYGVVTENSFQIKARTGDGKTLTFKIGENTYDLNPIDNDTVHYLKNNDPESADYYYELSLNNLQPNTEYFVRVFYNNVGITSFDRKILTLGRDTLRFSVLSYQEKVKNNEFYNRLMSKNPDYILFLGDIDDGYSSNSLKKEIKEMYLDTLNKPNLKNATSFLPLEYRLNDYCGPETNFDSCSQNQKTLIKNIYSITFPNQIDNYQQTGLFSSYVRQNILFINLDTRTFMNKDTKTLLGNEQKNRILSILRDAKINNNIKSIIMTTTTPWNYYKDAYERDWIKQKSYSLSEEFEMEKMEIANAINEINFKDENQPNFKPIMMIIGEKMSGFDSGLNNNYGGFPIAVCGAVSKYDKGNCKGGPYSHGYSKDNDNQYCTVEVYNKESNSCIKVSAYVVIKKREETIFIYDTCEKVKYQKNLNAKCPILGEEKVIHSFIVIGSTIFIFFFVYYLGYQLSKKTFSYNELTHHK